ncbi:hypothetical protein HZA33_03380 [Candidatus Pacearchaeota archaeon]|nr:hypothetical protein [Candidatus Pacearchaeota archaeon]
MRENKRGISELIAYALLVGLAISLSVIVYMWLEVYVKPSSINVCPSGTSLIIEDYSCSLSGILTLKVKNKGLFNVSGFILRINNRSKLGEPLGNPIYRLRPTTGPGAGGDFFVFGGDNEPLAPGLNKEFTDIAYCGTLTEIEIQPIRLEEGIDEPILCDKAVIRQKVSLSSGCKIEC